MLCDDEGKPLTQKMIQVMMRRAARRANVKPGVHILRHTFCSHLAMRGAPARAIQELAGHQDLGIQKDTGCKVNVKTAGTSDEMVSLMTRAATTS